MKNICIIGGSGFVGTSLLARLSLNSHHWKLYNFDKVMSRRYPELTTIADVRLPEQLGTIPNGSVLINLAAEHRDDVRPTKLYHDVNVQGAINLCELAKQRGIKKIIFTSSVAVYGFAKRDADEQSQINPFNEYGKTKYEAEQVLRAWQAEAPSKRTLVIIRPTVIFGKNNRGNVYNLLRQIASGRFVMVGNGKNIKSLAYVENVAAFIEFSLTSFCPGVHCFNYVDKPDFSMNDLIGNVKRLLGGSTSIRFRLPFQLGILIAGLFDLVSRVTGRKFSVSTIRIRKFCADSVYSTSIDQTAFVRPVPLEKALQLTVRHEFLESRGSEELYFTE